MKNKKGFTLIETLIIIIILAILLGIAVPSITKLLKRGTNEYYHSIENEIKASGMDYLETYRTLLPRQIGNVTVIDLKELVDNKYIDEIKDEEGNLCTGKITAKKIDSGTYEYYSCLKCGNSYNSKEENCEYTEYDNTYVDQHLYNITVDKYSYTVNQGDSFNLPLGKVYYNGQLINDKLEGNPSKIDTDILGTTEVIYFYNGAKKVVTVEVIDKTKPTKPEVVLKKNNANGQTYLSSTWFSGDIYQLFKSTDYTTPGVMGSGIKKYQISTDGTNFNDLTGNTKIDTQNGSRKYYVRSVDNNNNISNVNNYVIKIDKEIPKCELEVKSGTLGNNGWYKSDLTIGFKSTTETVSSLVHSSIDITSVTLDTPSTTSIATLIDEAGNVGTCQITVKLDETNPNVTVKLVEKVATFTVSDNFGVIQYGVNSSTTTEPSYTEIDSTTNKELTWTATAAGDYVVWVKDESGRTSYAEFNVPASAFIEVGKVWAYNSVGQNYFTAPCSGVYRFVLYGGKGGSYGGSGGRGGVVTGYKYLNQGTQLSIYVGGGGSSSIEGYGGANGGATGGPGHPYYGGGGGGGGGATHVATAGGTLASLRYNKGAVLLVAGGGGGGSNSHSGYNGGAGGGARGGTNCNGYVGSYFSGYEQTAATTSRPGLGSSNYALWYGYIPPTERYEEFFGKGVYANGSHKDSGNTWGANLWTSGGGGGGYYGGGTTFYSGGGGGSAYLSGMSAFTYNGTTYSPSCNGTHSNTNGSASVTLMAK